MLVQIKMFCNCRELVSVVVLIAIVFLGGDAAELAVDAAAPVVAAAAALEAAAAHGAPAAPAAQAPAAARRRARARVAAPADTRYC